MPKPRMRPEFTCSISVEPDAFWRLLDARLAESDAPVRGQRFDGGAILRVLPEEQHLWSPALYLRFEEEEPGRFVLHGRFSPSSPVWTAFVAIYLALFCLAVASACYGGAQILMQETPWAFWGVPAAIALAAFTYGAAFIGQGLGGDDMYRLHSFVDHLAADASRLVVGARHPPHTHIGPSE